MEIDGIIDEKEITPSDYTIMVKGIPIRETDNK